MTEDTGDLEGIYSYKDQNVSFAVTVTRNNAIFIFMNDKYTDEVANQKFKDIMIKQFNNRGVLLENGKYYRIYIPKDDFYHFKQHVLNNESTTKWNTYVGSINVHGTWLSKAKAKAIEEDQSRTNMEAAISGTYPKDKEAKSKGGKSKHSHRNPTKRRRNRRGNRKTKKN